MGAVANCIGAGRRGKPRVVRVKGLSAAELANDANPRVFIQEIVSKKSGLGLHTALLGFLIHATIQVDVVAANLAAAYTGRKLLGLFRDISLTSFGRPLFGAGLDGRRLRDQQLITNGALTYDDPTTIADADATNDIYNLRLFYSFAPTIYSRIQEDRKRDGAIPLAAFGEDDSLSWVNRSAPVEGAVAGLTYDGMQSCDVYAVVVDDEYVSLDALPFLEEVNTPQTQFSFNRQFGDRPGVIESAVLRHTDEDTSGLPLSTEYADITVEAGPDSIIKALTMARAREQMEAMCRFGRNLQTDFTTYGATTPFGAAASGFLPLVPYHPGMERADMSDGPIKFECTRTTRTNTRILVKSWSAPPLEWREKLAGKLGIEPSQLDRRGVASKNISPEVLPQKIVNAPSKAA